MEISAIAALATEMETARTGQAVGVAVLKKALDIEAAGTVALIQAIPGTPSFNLPPHLGQNLNTVA